MFSSKPIEKHQYLYLLIIVILAASFRLFHLNYQSLWLDELYSIVPADPNWPASMVIEYSKKDQPPAYFLSLHYWFQAFPYTDYFGRLFSAILGILGVIAIFFLGKEFKDTTVGLTASFIAALNHFHIYYSQEVRFYSLLFLLTTLSYYLFIKCYKCPIIINYFFYIIISAGLLYTHYYGMFVLFSQFVIFIICIFKGRRDRGFILYSILSGISIVLLFQPWIPIVIRDSNVDPNLWWIIRPDELFIFEYLYDYFGKNPYHLLLFFICAFLFTWKALYPAVEKIKLTRPIIIKISLVLVCTSLILKLGIPHLRAVVPHEFVYIPLAIIYIFLFCVFLTKLYKRLPSIATSPPWELKDIDIFLILSVWIILGYLIPYSRSITNTPMMIDRYTIICLPAIFMIFALGLAYITSLKIRLILISILFISTIINYGFFNEYYTAYKKSQFRDAAKKVIEENRSQSKVFSRMTWHFRFYFMQYNSPLELLIDPDQVDFEKAIANEKELWVLQGHGISLMPEQFNILNRDFNLVKRDDYPGEAFAAHYIRK